MNRDAEIKRLWRRSKKKTERREKKRKRRKIQQKREASCDFINKKRS